MRIRKCGSNGGRVTAPAVADAIAKIIGCSQHRRNPDQKWNLMKIKNKYLLLKL